MEKKSELKSSIESSLKLYEYFLKRSKTSKLSKKELNECKILKSFLQYIRTLYVYENIRDIISDNAESVMNKVRDVNDVYQLQIDSYEQEKSDYSLDLSNLQNKYSKLKTDGGFLSEEDNEILKNQMLKSLEQLIETTNSTITAISEKVSKLQSRISFNSQIVDDSMNVSQELVKKLLSKEEKPMDILKRLLKESVDSIVTTTGANEQSLLEPGNNKLILADGKINRPFVDLCISYLKRESSLGLYSTISKIGEKCSAKEKNDTAISDLPTLYTNIDSLQKDLELKKQEYETKKEQNKSKRKIVSYVFGSGTDEEELDRLKKEIDSLGEKLQEQKNLFYNIIAWSDLFFNEEFLTAIDVKENLIRSAYSDDLKALKVQHIEKILSCFKRAYPNNLNTAIEILKKRNARYGEELSGLYQSMPEEYRNLKMDDISRLRQYASDKAYGTKEWSAYYEYLKILDLLVIIDEFNKLQVKDKLEVYSSGIKTIASDSIRENIESEIIQPTKKL